MLIKQNLQVNHNQFCFFYQSKLNSTQNIYRKYKEVINPKLHTIQIPNLKKRPLQRGTLFEGLWFIQYISSPIKELRADPVYKY